MSNPTIRELPLPLNNKKGWPWTEGGIQLLDKKPEGKVWPKISIVTPSYNQGQFLEETIRSVLLQGYPNLEYIIIDGGSSDDSVEIIKKYSPWLSYWVSEPDSGQSNAINKGWERATGEIIAYLNSDDTYLPGAMASAAKALAEYPDVSMIYGDCHLIDEDSKVNGAFCGEEFNLKKMLFGNLVPQQTVFFRKQVLDKIGYLDESLHFVMDRDMWIRIGMAFEVRYISGVSANMREHSSAKSTAQIKNFLPERLKVIRKVCNQIDTSRNSKILKRKAFSHNYMLIGKHCYETRDVKMAKNLFIKSILEYPPVLHNKYVVRTLVKCIIGERLTSLVKRLKNKIFSH